jgi:hypothetical protein
VATRFKKKSLVRRKILFKKKSKKRRKIFFRKKKRIKLRQLRQKDVESLRAYILDKQKGVCPICEKTIKDPCLDHHHSKKIKGTGRIRGVLCRTCNSFIAKGENNCTRHAIRQVDLPRILRACARYLEKEQFPFLHPSEAPKPKILKKSSYNKLKKVYDGRARFPGYREGKKRSEKQKLTKPFKILFEKYGIEPEFYK